jgi:hypothetical protein
MRLSFCAVEEPKLEEGARRLGEVLRLAAAEAPADKPDLTDCLA